MEDERIPAFGSTWKMYFPSLEETPSEQDLVEILGAVKVEKHYQAKEPALVTQTKIENGGE